MTSTTPNDNGNAKTVVFNVGGTKYEVAKTTIEAYPNTMLARLVSDTWSHPDNENKEIFIDRNGSQFQFVLSYMRDKCVHLPANVTKAAILKDLEFFGFENIPGNTFGGSCNYEAMMTVKSCREAHRIELQEFATAIKEMETKRDVASLAYACFDNYFRQGTFRAPISDSAWKNLFLKGDEWFRQEYLNSLNEQLAKYGLQYVSHAQYANPNITVVPVIVVDSELNIRADRLTYKK